MLSKRSSLTIGHFPIIDHLILGVAQYHDGAYFQHLELKTKEFSTWRTMSDELRAGTIDGTFIPGPLAMELIRNGFHGKIVLLGQREGQVFTVRNEITDVAMLKGKTVLIPDVFSTGHIFLDRILKSVGLDRAKDISIVSDYNPTTDITKIFHENKIQAFMSAEPRGTIVSEAGDGYIMKVSQGMQTHHICCVLVMREDIIEHTPDAMRELIESLVKAGMFINAYPHQAADVGTDFMHVSKKIALTSLTHHKGHVLFWDLLPRVEDFQEIQDAFIDELKVWKEPADVASMLDASFAQQAYRAWMIDTRREVKDKGEARVLPGNFKEAVGRFVQACKDPVEVTGQCQVKAGQRYPKADKEKGFVTFSPDSMKEPDLVVLRLSEQDAMRCMTALGFGKHAHADILKPQDDGTYEIEYQAFKFLVLLLAYY